VSSLAYHDAKLVISADKMEFFRDFFVLEAGKIAIFEVYN